MIYKLSLSFDYPLALGNHPKLTRFLFLLVHYLLAVGFFFHPTVLLLTSLLSAILLGVEMLGNDPLKKDNIKFGWQRVAVSAMIASGFLGLYAHGEALSSNWAGHWWWISIFGLGLNLYDGYLAWRGVTGPFYIK